jgi:tetratricopeptide (TPR) repeat protein
VSQQVVGGLQPPSEEEQNLAKTHFQYAHRAATGGNYDLAIQFLRSSCKLAPANLAYRQALRKAQKAKYKNNRRGSVLAPLTTLLDRLRMRGAAAREDHRRVLECAEAILARNPWDKGAQLLAAQAAVALGLPVVAIWVLQQAREKYAKDAPVNRALARLLEQEGYFGQAIQLWELVRQAVPTDREAQDKVKQLGATETIARGKYGEAVKETEETKEEEALADPSMTPPPQTRKLAPVRARMAALKEKKPAVAETEPAGPEDYLRRAALCRRNGRLAEAKSILERGLAASGQAPPLVLALEDLQIEELRQERAELQAKARAHPDDEAAGRSLAKLDADLNARELAYHRKRAEYDPADNGNRFELGLRLLRAGDVDAAITELQALRSDARLRWKALLQLGHCFQKRRNWPLARRNFEEALRILPPEEGSAKKELLLHLAKGHAGAGEYARAVELAIELADLDFSYGNVGKLLDEWQRRAGPSAGGPAG